MSITSAELIAYGSANMPEADSLTTGGAISTGVRVVFDDSSLANTLEDTVEALSSSGSDTTQTCTVTGRNAAGVIVSDIISLNGTNPVSGAVTFERVLKIVISAAHVGTVTVRKATGDTTIAAIEPGVLTIRRPFYDVAADVSGGSTRNYYEKIFIKNTNSTLTLTNASVTETADPLSTLTFALSTGIDDTETTANRQTAPVGIDSFSSSLHALPGNALAAGSAIGVWMKLTLSAGAAAAKTTYTLQMAGTST